MPDTTRTTIIGLLVVSTVLLAASVVIPILGFNIQATLITIPGSDYYSARAGDPFEITCEAQGSGEFSNMEWLNPLGYRIRNGNPGVKRSGSSCLKLFFDEPRMADSGVYKCVAQVGNEVLQVEIFIHFYGGVPIFDVGYEKVQAEEGSELVLNCSATGEWPIEYVWYDQSNNIISSNNSTLVFSRTSGNVSNLIMSDVQSDHAGVYICSASNIHGLTSKLYEVTVVGAPGNNSDNGTGVVRSVWTTDITTNSVRFYIATSGTVERIEVMYVEDLEKAGNNIIFSRGSDYIIKNLLPAGRYTFRFRVLTSSASGDWTDAHDVTLLPDKPDVVLYIVGDDKVKIQWMVAKDQLFRRTVDKHQLSYYSLQRVNGTSWKPSPCVVTIDVPHCAQSTHTLTDFSRKVYYELQMRAHTVAGYGEAYRMKFFLP